jgi:hypothetical protein
LKIEEDLKNIEDKYGSMKPVRMTSTSELGF